jgi:ABC-type glycerol-3-phosphate transport system permease component
MLERMIIDISKWIVIILIFFIAFACSLFLIFSYFAVSLEQHKALTQPSNTVNFQIKPIIQNQNSTTNQCPDIFYDLIGQSTSYPTYKIVFNDSDDDINSACDKDSEDYEKIKNVGPYPAIHYFGQSFGATLLTTFFTLFGVIFEDNIPVNIIKFF